MKARISVDVTAKGCQLMFSLSPFGLVGLADKRPMVRRAGCNSRRSDSCIAREGREGVSFEFIFTHIIYEHWSHIM